MPDSPEDLEAECLKEYADDETPCFVAELDGEVVGKSLGVLGEAVIDWAHSAGKPSIVVDWRSTNLLSSRTWPRLGFDTTWYRLHRHVAY